MPSKRRKAAAETGRGLNLHHLIFFGFDDFVDSADELVGDFLYSFLAVLGFVRGDRFFLFRVLELLDGDPAVIAHRNAELLGDFLNVLHQFLAPLFGKLRQRHADDFSIVGRRQPQIGLENRLLDVPQSAAVVRLNDQQPRLRRGQSRYLIQGSRGAVIFNHDMLKQRRGSTAGAQLGEILAQRDDGEIHFFLQLSENRLIHRFPPLTKVPIGSPETTRLMLPFSIILKTMIGTWLSMQSEMAVESMTLSSRFNTSM